jgi:hypothetical protein
MHQAALGDVQTLQEMEGAARGRKRKRGGGDPGVTTAAAVGGSGGGTSSRQRLDPGPTGWRNFCSSGQKTTR